jgi:hypothetical protein
MLVGTARPWDSYGDAARRVLALVSGLPAQDRGRWRFLVLQAYVDESYSDGLFVMAGYVATIDQWAPFSDEWKSLLGLGDPFRRIKEFHQIEMTDSAIALEQSELFFRVAEKHLTTYVCATLRLEDIRRARESIDWPDWMDADVLGNEYFICFDNIINGLAINQEKLGLFDPIDVIFDNHSNQDKCGIAWRAMKAIAPPQISRLLGDTPTFRSSEYWMPLQAADQLAYWERKSQLDPNVPKDGTHKLMMPWQIKSNRLKWLRIFMTTEMLQTRFKNAVLGASLVRSGAFPDVVDAALGPNHRKRLWKNDPKA